MVNPSFFISCFRSNLFKERCTEFGNYETEVNIEKPHSNGYVFMEEDTEECNSENLPELQLSHSSLVSSEECDNELFRSNLFKDSCTCSY
jgi:hypothetical protein